MTDELNEELPEEPGEEYAAEEEPEGHGGFAMDAFIPLVLLAISFIVLLGWQVSNASTQRTLLENAIENQKTAVAQSQQVQAGVKKLAADLVEAAQTDELARAIAAKYIKPNPNAAPAASP